MIREDGHMMVTYTSQKELVTNHSKISFQIIPIITLSNYKSHDLSDASFQKPLRYCRGSNCASVIHQLLAV